MKKITINLFSLVCGLILPILVVSQTQTKEAAEKSTIKKVSATLHHETLEGEYIDISNEKMLKSPAYRESGNSYFTTQVNISSDGENIQGDAANEPSMTVDPTNPDKMVIGWRQFNTINNNFRQAGYGITLDGGESWEFPGVIEPGVFRSDPVLAADSDGNIYYNSLTSSGGDFTCQVFKMEAGSTEWDDGTYALGGDKQWMIIDQTGGMGDGNHYAFWTASFSICFPDQFTRSTDGGESYDACVTVAGIPRWGTLATGSDGTLYTAGYSDFGFILSTSSTAMNSQWPVSWDSFSEVDLDGYPGFGGGPNPGGLLGQTSVGVDISDGPNSGNIYVLSSVERISNNDPLDVMFARSTDGGFTWDEPIRVNQDISTSNWQWFGTMSVAPDGRIDVVWLDTRDVPTGYYSALYYAYSIDGGETFSQDEKISEVFDPHLGWPQQDKMGDYFHMVSDLDYAHLAWANTLNGEQDVYYTRINPWFVGIDDNEQKEDLSVHIFPNPASDAVTVKTRVSTQGEIEYRLFDLLGNEIQRSTRSDRNMDIGTSKISVSSLPDGIYYLKVTAEGKTTTRKLVVSH